MLAILAATLIFPQVQGTAAITYVSPGARLAILLPELGRAMNREIQVDNDLRNEVAVLRIQGLPATEVLKRISDEFDVAFVPVKSGLVARRTSEMKKRRADRDHLLRLEAFESYREQLAKEIIPPKPDTEATIREALIPVFKNLATMKSEESKTSNADISISSSSKFVMQKLAIVNAFDSNFVASMYTGQRIVFSTNPTAVQRPMKPAMRAAVSKMIAGDPMWQRLIAERLLATPLSAYARTRLDLEADDKGIFPIRNVAKVDIAIVQSNPGGFDISGLYVASDGSTISGFGMDSPGHEIAFAKVRKPNIWNSADLIEPPPFCLTSAPRLRGPHRGDPPSEADLNLLLHPDRYEPLGLTIGPMLVRYAELSGRNLIASPSEYDFSMWVRTSAAMTVKAFETRLKGEDNEVRDDGLWISVFPHYQRFEGQLRADRQGLAAHAQLVNSDRVSSLDEQARYYVDALGAPMLPLATILEVLSCGGFPYIETDGDGSTVDDVALYRSFTDYQRDQLATGIRYRLLDPAQRSMIHRLVFDKHIQFWDLSKSTESSFEGLVTSEITELLGSGIPEDAIISMTQDLTTAARAVRIVPAKNPRVRGTGLGAEQFAQQFLQNDRAKFAGTTAPFRTDRAIIYRKQSAVVQIAAGPNLLTKFSLSYCDSRDGKEVAWADLPAEFRKAVEASLVEKRKALAEERLKATPPPK